MNSVLDGALEWIPVCSSHAGNKYCRTPLEKASDKILLSLPRFLFLHSMKHIPGWCKTEFLICRKFYCWWFLIWFWLLVFRIISFEVVIRAGSRFWPADGLEQGVSNKQHFLLINPDDLKCLILHTAGQLHLLCRLCPSCPKCSDFPWVCSGRHKSRHLSILSGRAPLCRPWYLPSKLQGWNCSFCGCLHFWS